MYPRPPSSVFPDILYYLCVYACLKVLTRLIHVLLVLMAGDVLSAWAGVGQQPSRLSREVWPRHDRRRQVDHVAHNVRVKMAGTM